MTNVVKFSKEKPSVLNDKYLRTRDLKEIFVGISPAVITKWSKMGILKPYKIGGCLFFKSSDIKQLLEDAKI